MRGLTRNSWKAKESGCFLMFFVDSEDVFEV